MTDCGRDDHDAEYDRCLVSVKVGTYSDPLVLDIETAVVNGASDPRDTCVVLARPRFRDFLMPCWPFGRDCWSRLGLTRVVGDGRFCHVAVSVQTVCAHAQRAALPSLFAVPPFCAPSPLPRLEQLRCDRLVVVVEL